MCRRSDVTSTRSRATRCAAPAPARCGAARAARAMEPFLTGGEMINSVSLERTTWNEIPWKFEAGTPAIAECIGLGAAVDYLQRSAWTRSRRTSGCSPAYGHDLLARSPRSPLRAAARAARGILTFNLADVHPHDVAQVLDGEAIASGPATLRSACCRPLRRCRDHAGKPLPVQHDRRSRPAGRGHREGQAHVRRVTAS